jgi:hypothetical protein
LPYRDRRRYGVADIDFGAKVVKPICKLFEKVALDDDWGPTLRLLILMAALAGLVVIIGLFL